MIAPTADSSIWIGLVTLIVLEVVLGINNLVFIAMLADKLPSHQRNRARIVGLSLAPAMHVVLLFSIFWIVRLTCAVMSDLGRDRMNLAYDEETRAITEISCVSADH